MPRPVRGYKIWTFLSCLLVLLPGRSSVFILHISVTELLNSCLSRGSYASELAGNVAFHFSCAVLAIRDWLAYVSPLQLRREI